MAGIFCGKLDECLLTERSTLSDCFDHVIFLKNRDSIKDYIDFERTSRPGFEVSGSVGRNAGLDSKSLIPKNVKKPLIK